MKLLQLILAIFLTCASAVQAYANGRVTFVNSLGPLPPAAAASKRALSAVDQNETLEFSVAFNNQHEPHSRQNRPG